MKKHLLIISGLLTLISLGIVIISGCTAPGASSAKSSEKTSDRLPGNYKLDVPDSLSSGAKSRGGDISEDSLGFAMIQNMVNDMLQKGSKISVQFVFVSKLIEDIPANVQYAATSNNTIKITKDLYDKIALMDGKAPDLTIDAVVPFPPFLYMTKQFYMNPESSFLIPDKIDLPKDADKYDYMIVIFDKNAVDPPRVRAAEDGEMLQYILWTEDKSKVKVFTDHNFTGPDGIMIEYTYDDKAKKSTNFFGWKAPPLYWDGDSWEIDPMAIGFDIDDYGISMEQIDPANKGIMIHFWQKVKRVKEDNKYHIFDFFVEGYADNNGGYVESKFIDKNFKGHDNQEVRGFADSKIFMTREKFDGSGTLVIAQHLDPVTGIWVTDLPKTAPPQWTDPVQKNSWVDNKGSFAATDVKEFDDYLGDNDTVIKVQIPKPVELGGPLNWYNRKRKILVIATMQPPPMAPGVLIDHIDQWPKVKGFFVLFKDQMYLDHSNDAGGIVLPFFLRNIDKANVPSTFLLVDVSSDDRNTIMGGVPVNRQPDGIYKP